MCASSFVFLRTQNNAWHVCVCECCSVVSDSVVTPWTVPHQDPLSVGFPGKNTGLGCHFLLQGIFLTQGLNPNLLCLLCWQADSLPTAPTGKSRCISEGLSEFTKYFHKPCLILFKIQGHTVSTESQFLTPKFQFSFHLTFSKSFPMRWSSYAEFFVLNYKCNPFKVVLRTPAKELADQNLLSSF